MVEGRNAHGAASDVEEHRLIRPLQVNVQGESVAAAPGDQRLDPRALLDPQHYGVRRIRRGFVAEVEAGVEPDVDTARDDPQAQMRRLLPAVRIWDTARLDGLEAEQPALRI